MTKARYEALHRYFRQHSGLAGFLCGLNKVFTRLIYCLYAALLLGLLIRQDGRLLRVFLVPGVSFVLLSLVRDRLNFPRPYEVYGIPPTLRKNTKGHSFPSRHVFSVFVIAMAYFYVLPAVGGALLGVGTCLAVIRVLTGVHFPRDVLVGALVGIAAGGIGFYGIGIT